MQDTSGNLNDKIRYIPVWICIAIAIIGGRLYYLQIDQAHILSEQSHRNCTRVDKIQSPRGNIVDVTGVLLATNRPITNVYWKGTGGKKLTHEQYAILQKIEAITGKSCNDADMLHAIGMAEKKQTTVLLASDLTFEQLSQLQEQFTLHTNVLINTHFKRFYPYGSFACHIVGYLGIINLDTQGKMGLEKMFESVLKGEQGVALRKITSTGKNLTHTPLKDAMTGKHIETTLDIDIQDMCETIFPADQIGSCIIMDPETGALLGVVSRPNFDPNIFLNPIDTHQWQALQENQPFINRAFGSAYPPGSIFKLVSMSAALEHGVIQAESTCLCKGYATFCDRNYFCSRRTGHGVLTMQQALAQSCNIPFFEKIGRQLTIDTIAHYAHKFGLGQKTDLCFPEKEGLIPTSAWKKKVKGERWWPGETLSASIGQSFILVTPIQIACMISSIFTGFLPKPRILQQEPIVHRPLDIAPETLEFLKESMRSVVTVGTGIRISQVKNIEIYAKTSTAQVSDYSKRELGRHHKEHGWFVGYFRYKESKPLTIVIMAENVSSSREATKYAKNFLIEYKKLVDKRTSK